MSWKPAVQVNGDPTWSYNALRFETKEEAMASARDLMNRWLLVTAFDAHESEDPVNYKLVDDGGVLVLTAVEKEEA